MLPHTADLAASPPMLYKLIVGGAWRLLFCFWRPRQICSAPRIEAVRWIDQSALFGRQIGRDDQAAVLQIQSRDPASVIDGQSFERAALCNLCGMLDP